MKPPNSLISELDDYFANIDYQQKCVMLHYGRVQIYELLEDCGFVYVAERGQVIHKDRYCEYSAIPVHIEQAIKFGYKKLCKKCATGTKVEDLFWERMNKLKEK